MLLLEEPPIEGGSGGGAEPGREVEWRHRRRRRGRGHLQSTREDVGYGTDDVLGRLLLLLLHQQTLVSVLPQAGDQLGLGGDEAYAGAVRAIVHLWTKS